jgi:flagellin
MAFYINTNIASLESQNYLSQTNNAQTQAIEEVTSGLRIVNSGNDAAGLAIANGYRSTEAVLTQGIQNANNGLSQLQIADGGISNISQLLDRARTLATESASGTFTGNRGVLNSEFQSVLTEINRQAQSIGLNQGGSFAKTLNVFIGGGQASNGISATTNGTVSLNLSQSTVDSASLGLSGVQATGVTGTNIGPGATATSLSDILANTANTSTEATPGYTTFNLKGPGFGGNGVSISVNTANLGSTSDLVAAVNSAITAAGSNGTQQGTALANAGITASINTDANNNQQLAFTSSTAAFQVTAGDQVANALLGNFAQNATITGTDTNPTVATNGAAGTRTLTLAVNGATPISVVVTNSAATSKAQIVKDLNNNAGFKAVATATLNGNQVTIQSNSNAATSSIAITSTALATSLGLSTTTATAANASTGASLNTQVTAANNTAAGATTFGTAGAGTITFQFQGAGQTTPTAVALQVTANETVTQAITALSTAVSTNPALETAGISLSTSTATNALTFTSTSGQQFTVGVTGDTQNLLGFGSFVTGANNSFDYSTLTGSAYNSPAGAAAGTANLEFSINGGASSANQVSVNLGLGDATAATVAATANPGTVNIDSTDNQVNLNVNGTGVAVTLTSSPTATLNNIADEITTQLNATLGAGHASASVVNNQLTITTTADGANQSIQVTAGSANTALGLATGLSTGTARSGTSIASALNTAFATNTTLQAAGLTASFAAGQLTISSNNGTNFRADAYGATASAEVGGTAGSGGVATAGLRAGATAGTYDITAANNVVSVKIDGGATQNITLTQGAARTATQVVNDINASLTGAVASVNGAGDVQILSNTTGALSSVQFVASAPAASGTAVGATTGPFDIVAATSGTAVGSVAEPYVFTGANDVISVHVDGGTAQTVAITNTDTTAADVLGDINALNGGAGLVGATASAAGGVITITSNSTGPGSSIVFDADVTSTANATLGFLPGAQPTYDGAASTNNQLSISVDGGAAQTVSLTTGATQTSTDVAADINAINGGLGLFGATASGAGGVVTITSDSTGTASSIKFNTVANDAAGVGPGGGTLGLVTGVVAGYAGTNAVATANAPLGFTAGTSTGTAAAGSATITTGVNDTLDLNIDGTAANVVFAAGATSAASAATQINTQVNTALGTVGLTYASVQNGRVQIASQTTGTGSSVTIGSGDANATFGFTGGTTTGTAANLGYGTAGATFTGTVATAAPTAAPTFDSGGASQTTDLTFTPIVYGSDQQTVTITAPGSTGTQQSLSINLSNNATSTNGSSIDQAVSAINTALQQSNNPTLTQITAVKDDSGGTEQISFISTVNNFQVAIGRTGSGAGIGSQGTTAASTVTGGGSTAEIADITGANAAVNALANAVTALGNAQAVVGRGENQFTYATNLAQSQLTNLASAEANIRDADLASESAALTQTQIQLQAGIAALAQANSAPQQVLKLLQ